MKISQEVREFAANNPNSDLMFAPKSVEEAEAGMQDMAKVYKDKGQELYLPADEVDEPAE